MHVLIDVLDPGSLALYDWDDGFYFCWDPTPDTRAPAWHPRQMRQHRTLISTALDEPLTRLVDEIRGRLEGLKPGRLSAEGAELLWYDDGPNALETDGTLLISLRSCAVWEDFDGWVNQDGTPFVDRHGVLLMGGMAYLPTVQEGAELRDFTLEYYIEQTCLGLAGQDYDRQVDGVRTTIEHHLQARASLAERAREMEAKRKAAEVKARALLVEHLSEEQREELDRHKWFHVMGKDGFQYRIVFKAMHNVFRVEDGRRTVEYCLVSRDPIPTYDLMLMQKLMLEVMPDEFHRIANAWTIQDEGSSFTWQILDPETLEVREVPVHTPFLQEIIEAVRGD